jgi:hypothetical protein
MVPKAWWKHDTSIYSLKKGEILVTRLFEKKKLIDK